MGGFRGSTSVVSNIVTSDLQVDGTTMVVDETNNRLGIGTATPRTELTVEGTVTLKETDAAAADVASYGQLWVKDDSPNNLYFTDDGGNDVQITNGGSLASSGGSLSGLGSTDNVILRTNGTGGQTAQGSGIAVDDSNNVSGMGTLACGATITIGADSDGADRSVTFGHSTLKTIMGIDDSADAFVINTDDAFDGTLANNSLSLDASHNMIVAGNVTSGGSFIIGSADMNETDLEKLDGITNGTAAANKAVVLDASKDIGTLGAVTLASVTGSKGRFDVANGNLLLTGTLDVGGAAQINNTLTLSGSSTEALRITKDDGDAREIVFENDGVDKAAIYTNSAENFFIRQEVATKDINLRIGSTNALIVDGSESELVSSFDLKVGTAAGSGKDAFLFTAGTAAHVGIQWDADGNTEGTLIGGADDHGVDLKFFGETSGKFMHWDMSGDELILASSTKLSFHDAGGGEYIHASGDNVLELFAGTDIKLNTDTITMASANAQDPLVIIKNTTNDTAGARLKFLKDKGAAAADNDIVGEIQFFGDDDAQQETEYAGIIAQIADASNSAEGGRLLLRVATHDGEMQAGLTIVDGDQEDEVDVVVGNGDQSQTTIAGDLVVTSDATFKDVIQHGDPAAPGRVIIYEEVDIRQVTNADNTVSAEFGQKIPQDSVVTRVVAIVKTASNLGTHNVQIRFDVGSGRAVDSNISGTSQEALGAGAANTRSSTNVGSAVDIDLTAAKESYINDTPSFMTTADVFPYICNAGTANGTTDSSSGTLLVYIEYYGLD